MDYHSIHGHDVSSFDLPSTHRLPTVSAADALDDLDADTSRYVSTSLPLLDEALAVGALDARDPEQPNHGGVPKGQVTEIWGPPGVGKTTFGLQLASNALRESKSVVWVDCLSQLCYDRLADISAAPSGDDLAGVSGLERFLHYTCPTLPHFIAIACRPTASTIPEGTSLVVIDSLSALVNHAFPRATDSKTPAKNGNKGPSPSARRLQLLQYMVGALQKLAATRDIAVVVLTQCATRMQGERGASLIPAINANVWDQCIANRLVLFRDWAWNGEQAFGLHFVGIQKFNGKATPESVENISAFQVERAGLSAAKYDASQPSITLSSTPARKRKFGESGFEIPDSDDEDYGWDEGEDAMPKMPPQWQGSEDILLGQHPESEDDEEAGADIEAEASGEEPHPIDKREEA
ncbi:DNA repair protein rhp55 [Pleurostoma richardsiae]|uniref:DNA repair protein rhp55 n=1 Tax=Pleurostoma richardsiae TaxID=41990 RepID=A0AA38RG85_9PEZI|nr:DNA repair protein rhp55 [Pleurostoma richardsiae]